MFYGSVKPSMLAEVVFTHMWRGLSHLCSCIDVMHYLYDWGVCCLHSRCVGGVLVTNTQPAALFSSLRLVRKWSQTALLPGRTAAVQLSVAIRGCKALVEMSSQRNSTGSTRANEKNLIGCIPSGKPKLSFH